MELKGLVCLAFGGSIGITFVILACALPQFNLWWPFFVFAFYILAILPTIIAKRSESRARIDLSIFLTVGFVLSSFYLPIVMARSQTILWAACYLTITGNVIVYLTMFAFFAMMDGDNFEYGGGF
ncbi:leptin receptor gene-related protein-like [Bradysia coprophila]|uniref:leptin receptor gene-related protein-like n=1 Tax=Bradysia coprophila TaxID=38358 RepID=UPI00187DDA18|nr:leptin receptor gene-related protein-like [Bradysia coprophila]